MRVAMLCSPLLCQPAKRITGLWLIVQHTLMSRDHLDPGYTDNTSVEKIDKWNWKRIITTSAALHRRLRSVLEAASLFTSPFILSVSLFMCLSRYPPPLPKEQTEIQDFISASSQRRRRTINQSTISRQTSISWSLSHHTFLMNTFPLPIRVTEKMQVNQSLMQCSMWAGIFRGGY